jgi:hypothetical protein
MDKAQALGARSYYKPAISGDAKSLVATAAAFDMVGVCCGGDATHIGLLKKARA